MVKRFIWLHAILIILAVASMASAESVRIVTASLAPYGYVENGHIAGLAHEISLAVAIEAGYVAEEKLGPISRGVKDMQTGDSEMMIMIPGPAIERIATNIGCVLPVETVVIGKIGQPLHSLDDVRGRKLGAVRDTEYDSRITRANGMILYPTEDYEHGMKMLMAHRVDFVIGPKFGLYYTARKLRLPRKAFGKPLVLSQVNGCLFVSNKTPKEKMERLSEAVQRLLENGTIEAIVAKYNL